MTKKSGLLTFLLSAIPGLPQIYLGYPGRGLLGLGITISYILAVFLLALVIGHRELLLLLLALPLFLLIGLLDAFILLGRKSKTHLASPNDTGDMTSGRERELLVLAALIPGGGQMYLGEPGRGLPLLVGFFGWLTFSTYLAVNFAGGFIVLWGLLPIIWSYSFFDALTGWKHQGEANGPRPPLAEEWERVFTGGSRNFAWAGILGLIPGLGHMYLGQLDKGLGIMAGFLLIVLLNSFLRFNFAFVVVPLLWFYSVFDTLTQLPALKAEQNSAPEVMDTPAAGRWLGYALVGGGILLLVESLLIPFLNPQLLRYLQPLVLALVLIGVGVKLLLGSPIPKRVTENQVARDGETK